MQMCEQLWPLYTHRGLWLVVSAKMALHSVRHPATHFSHVTISHGPPFRTRDTGQPILFNSCMVLHHGKATIWSRPPFLMGGQVGSFSPGQTVLKHTMTDLLKHTTVPRCAFTSRDRFPRGGVAGSQTGPLFTGGCRLHCIHSTFSRKATKIRVKSRNWSHAREAQESSHSQRAPTKCGSECWLPGKGAREVCPHAEGSPSQGLPTSVGRLSW